MVVEVSELDPDELSEEDDRDSEELEEVFVGEDEFVLALEEPVGDELVLVRVSEVDDSELLVMDAQVMLGLCDEIEAELPVALALEVAFADPLEKLDVDSDPVALDEVALLDCEALPLTELMLEDTVPELVLDTVDDSEEDTRDEEVLNELLDDDSVEVAEVEDSVDDGELPVVDEFEAVDVAGEVEMLEPDPP